MDLPLDLQKLILEFYPFVVFKTHSIAQPKYTYHPGNTFRSSCLFLIEDEFEMRPFKEENIIIQSFEHLYEYCRNKKERKYDNGWR